jgi:ribose transport system permease protein
MKRCNEQIPENRFFGLIVLVAMAVLFWAFFKILSPSNFGTGKLLVSYLQTSIQYAVGGLRPVLHRRDGVV